MEYKQSKKHRNSLRYNRMLKNIPSSKSLKEAAIKAGYAESTANSNVYSLEYKIRQDLSKAGYSKESIQAEFERISAKCEADGDYSNSLRGLENISKIQGLFKEGSTVNLGIFQQLSTKDIEDIDTIIDGA